MAVGFGGPNERSWHVLRSSQFGPGDSFVGWKGVERRGHGTLNGFFEHVKQGFAVKIGPDNQAHLTGRLWFLKATDGLIFLVFNGF